jgi:hypothetical protein
LRLLLPCQPGFRSCRRLACLSPRGRRRSGLWFWNRYARGQVFFLVRRTSHYRALADRS